VQKYEQLGELPSDLKRPWRHRTRANPFEGDWAEVEKRLQEALELEAKTLFDWLCELERVKIPGRAAAHPAAPHQ
jgi:hypothetical protein